MNKFMLLISTVGLFITSQSHAADANQPDTPNPIATCENSVLAPQYGPPPAFDLPRDVSQLFINDSARVLAGYEDGQTVYLNLSISVEDGFSLAQAGRDLQYLFAAAQLPLADGFSISVTPASRFFKLQIRSTAARDTFISALAKVDPGLNPRVHALRLSPGL